MFLLTDLGWNKDELMRDLGHIREGFTGGAIWGGIPEVFEMVQVLHLLNDIVTQ